MAQKNTLFKKKGFKKVLLLVVSCFPQKSSPQATRAEEEGLHNHQPGPQAGGAKLPGGLRSQHQRVLVLFRGTVVLGAIPIYTLVLLWRFLLVFFLPFLSKSQEVCLWHGTGRLEGDFGRGASALEGLKNELMLLTFFETFLGAAWCFFNDVLVF